MDSKKIREKFLEFFEKRRHKIVPSSSLVPEDDPSVLLTTAGVQQFKDYYLGKKDPLKILGSLRAASVQKSFRTTDIDSVGDKTHLTFFEMLGNFSFGDYFKKETIAWASDLIISGFKIPKSATEAYVFGGDKLVPFDKDSYKILKKVGFPESKIKKGARADNFWGPTGKEGPCGPTVDIYVNGVEIWSLVFNEYYCDKAGKLSPLKNKGVDTGMGLERLTQALQGVPTIFETDLFAPLLKIIKSESRNLTERSARVVADHLRAAVFLIADGVEPSNKLQGYILRRLIRRLYRHGRHLEFQGNQVYFDLIDETVSKYSSFYPELRERQKIVIEIFESEIQRFSHGLNRGLKQFDRLVGKYQKVIPGQEAFFLYQTYGFPVELTAELAKEQGLEVDYSGFEKARQEHQKLSQPE
jgi:alanyl-tRNA synthetase